MIVKPQQIGLREHNKRDKLRRIKAAATELFSLKGYDAATTRAIAKRARVSHATVFIYAKDKNELAYLIFCDKLEVAHRESFAAITTGMSLMEQLVTAFSGGYREYMKDITLGRVMLKTSSEFQFGEQARRVQGHRAELIGKLAELIANARQAQVIQTEEDPEFIARDLFGSVYASMRSWLAKENPDPLTGLGDLSRIIRLHIRALEPTPEAFAMPADSEVQAQVPSNKVEKM